MRAGDRGMLKRISNSILLTLLFLGYVLPLHTGGMVCAMGRSVPAATCGSCDGPLGSGAPALTAGSCCRFEAPRDVAPTPVLLVHCRNDHMFGPDHAMRLYEAAGEPRRLLMGDRFGHAEDGLPPAFAVRLARAMHEEMHLSWSA